MIRLSLTILTIFSFLLTVAQTPQALNYQAVARTANGQIIPSQNVTVRFSVLEGSATGTVIYQETHNVTTNNFGLFTLGIGKGTVNAGTFNLIPWETGNKYLRVEIAPQGGSNFLIQGTTQLLSVPYALYAERTKLLAGNNTVTIAGNTIMGNYQPANNTILITGNQIGANYQAANNTILINGNTIAGNYQPANNTIAITGNTIAGNYQAANNTVAITGNIIAGNYQAGNNTINITGNNITGNYQPANNTITITGNTIAANYQAGTGINIAGNVITATGSNLWVTDPNGIHNQSGRVGIGGNSGTANNMLTITQQATGGFSSALEVTSADQWHTLQSMLNTTMGPNNRYSFSLGGNLNAEIGPGNWGILNHSLTKWSFKINGSNNNIGIGMNNVSNSETPRSRLHVFTGDVNIDQIGSGIIMKSPNGQCWRVTVDNTGALVTTAITCP